MDFSVKEEIDTLIKKIKYFDHMYFIKNKRSISDFEYDKLRERLSELENKYPEEVRKDSPSLYLGLIQESSDKILHSTPMLSLQRSYDIEEIVKFCNKIFPEEMIVEPKVDGVAISATYENGYINSLALRGDGKMGENIFNKIHSIENLPHKIKENIEIRGEVYLKKDNSQKNKRNLAAGILRRKDNKYKLNFFPYRVINYSNNHQESMAVLKKYCTIHSGILVNSEEELRSAIKSTIDMDFDFEIDGVVIKTNNYELLKETTHRHPKNSIALKFIEKGNITKIEDIDWQMSRRGFLIPVAKIQDFDFKGVRISRVNLHNKAHIKKLKIGKGSQVRIILSGSIVPHISEVLIEKDESSLLKCPFCYHKVIEGSINYICNNNNCIAIFREKLKYFFKALKAKGVSDSILNRSWKLKKFDILEFLLLFKERNWIESLNEAKAHENFWSKTYTIKTLLIGMGIENVSEVYINNLPIKNTRDLEKLIDQNNIHKKFLNLKNFFYENKENLQKVEKLLSPVGVEPTLTD